MLYSIVCNFTRITNAEQPGGMGDCHKTTFKRQNLQEVAFKQTFKPSKPRERAFKQTFKPPKLQVKRLNKSLSLKTCR
jgi:hypothetical protein